MTQNNHPHDYSHPHAPKASHNDHEHVHTHEHNVQNIGSHILTTMITDTIMIMAAVCGDGSARSSI